MTRSTNHIPIVLSRRPSLLQRGLSLIEILVTVVVLSIGLLGIAATQTLGMQYSNDSYLRSQASMLLNELTERMSINIAAVDGNNVDGNNFDIGVFDMTVCGTAPAVICEAGTECTPIQLATYDMHRIACGYQAGNADGIVNIFPNGSLAIDCIDSDAGVDGDDCTDGSNHQLRIDWQRANSTPNRVEMLVRP